MFSPLKLKVHEGNIVKIVWVPPEYGDAVACVSADGIVSLLEEIVEGIIYLVFSFTCLVALFFVFFIHISVKSSQLFICFHSMLKTYFFPVCL